MKTEEILAAANAKNVVIVHVRLLDPVPRA